MILFSEKSILDRVTELESYQIIPGKISGILVLELMFKSDWKLSVIFERGVAIELEFWVGTASNENIKMHLLELFGENYEQIQQYIQINHNYHYLDLLELECVCKNKKCEQ